MQNKGRPVGRPCVMVALVELEILLPVLTEDKVEEELEVPACVGEHVVMVVSATIDVVVGVERMRRIGIIGDPIAAHEGVLELLLFHLGDLHEHHDECRFVEQHQEIFIPDDDFT